MRDSMTSICRHYFVSGKVQGVWFRASAKAEADRLKVAGWVRNLPDQRVEIVVCGELENIEIFQIWLQKGPLLAQISKVEMEDLPSKFYPSFDII